MSPSGVLERGDGSSIGVDQGQVSTTLGDFVIVWLIRGCAFGPLEASAVGGKTFTPDGKVR